jgi:kynurenine formamidase
MSETGEYIADIQLDRFIGTGCIIDVRGQAEILMKEEYKDIVKPDSIVHTQQRLFMLYYMGFSNQVFFYKLGRRSSIKR